MSIRINNAKIVRKNGKVEHLDIHYEDGIVVFDKGFVLFDGDNLEYELECVFVMSKTMIDGDQINLKVAGEIGVVQLKKK